MSAASDGCHTIVDLWQAMATRTGLSPVRVMSPARIASLKARIREVGIEAMREAIEKIEASDFCRGQNDRGWKAGIDFLCAANRLPRILEGQYDNRDSHQAYRNGASELARQIDELSWRDGLAGPDPRIGGPAGD